jgi:hypothetical protein
LAGPANGGLVGRRVRIAAVTRKTSQSARRRPVCVTKYVL